MISLLLQMKIELLAGENASYIFYSSHFKSVLALNQVTIWSFLIDL